MRFYAICLFFAAFLTSAVSLSASAQTFRISSGVNANGVRTYIEVYEYDYVEEKPQFPGAGDDDLLKYINANRRYPAEAYAHGIEGRVTCSFIVNTDGAISNVTVLRGVEPSLNREAVRLFTRMPAWSPGKLAGQNVPVRVICAVPFRK